MSRLLVDAMPKTLTKEGIGDGSAAAGYGTEVHGVEGKVWGV